jgi:hypothetical protein
LLDGDGTGGSLALIADHGDNIQPGQGGSVHVLVAVARRTRAAENVPAASLGVGSDVERAGKRAFQRFHDLRERLGGHKLGLTNSDGTTEAAEAIVIVRVIDAHVLNSERTSVLDFPAHPQVLVFGNPIVAGLAGAVAVGGERFLHDETEIPEVNSSGGGESREGVAVQISGPDRDSHREGGRGRGVPTVDRGVPVRTPAGQDG